MLIKELMMIKEAKEAKPLTFRKAQTAAKNKAKELIGGPVIDIRTAGYGGTDDEDAVCNMLMARTMGAKAGEKVVIEFEDEEMDDGAIELTLYDLGDGEKVVSEEMDEGGPSREGSVFYLSRALFNKLKKNISED